VGKRSVFFVSDQTGVTAETLGHSLLTQFDGAQYQSLSLPFVATVAQAAEVVQRIDEAARESALRPIVFATLVDDQVRAVLRQANALCLDFFAAFLGPLEAELAMPSAHANPATPVLEISMTQFMPCIRPRSRTHHPSQRLAANQGQR